MPSHLLDNRSCCEVVFIQKHLRRASRYALVSPIWMLDQG